MNKLMLFPIAFLLVLIVFGSIYTGETYDTGSTINHSSIEGIEIDDKNASIDVPSAGSYEFNIWDTTGVVLILTIAVGVGIVAGIKVLGSGLSPMSQKMIFDSILYGGLWACLSIVASDFLFAAGVTLLFWMILTIIYIMGMGSHMAQSDSG